MEEFKSQEREIKQAEVQARRSISPMFGRGSITPSIRKLQEVADKIKGRTTPRLQSKTKSVSSGGADIDDDYKSCNDDNPQPTDPPGERAIENSVITVNRT
jgi:hypothetical protein